MSRTATGRTGTMSHLNMVSGASSGGGIGRSSFIEVYLEAETAKPDSAMSSSELFKRFPRFVFHLTEEVGPGWFEDPYWQRYMLQAMGFLQVLKAISRESRLTK